METPLKTSLQGIDRRGQHLPLRPINQELELDEALDPNEQCQVLQLLANLCNDINKIVNKHQTDEFLINQNSQIHDNMMIPYQSFQSNNIPDQFYTNPSQKHNQQNKTQPKQKSRNGHSPFLTQENPLTQNIWEQRAAYSHRYDSQTPEVVHRLLAFKQQSEAKKLNQKQQIIQEEEKQITGTPQINQKSDHLKQYVPIYRRVEDEIKRKEQKIQEIKEKSEKERRDRNRALGILDDEDILKMKREKDIFLKTKFNIESFEEKYERQIKVYAEKKKLRELERTSRDSNQCTFTPTLITNSRSKSPYSKNTGGSSSTLNTEVIISARDKAVEDRLIEKGKKVKNKVVEQQKKLEHNFKPQLNQASLKMAQSRDRQINSSRVKNYSTDEVEKELISELSKEAMKRAQYGVHGLNHNNNRNLERILQAFRTTNN